jgi:hypothetical protein
MVHGTTVMGTDRVAEVAFVTSLSMLAFIFFDTDQFAATTED